MCIYGEVRPRTRCVLPFEAEPTKMHGLRRGVREQLKDWGASAIADEVQLAVTELATNVIKHVGQGASATLVMEPGADRLRVEVHDTSHTWPATARVECGDECGRGLHLLAAMAMNWGTIGTATGKAVWCELPLDQNARCLRSHRAWTLLGTYQDLAGVPAGLNIARLPVAEECATDLIADLLHWLAARGGDADAVLDRAQMHYEAEAS
ncbi:ATP-binding protein [Streptomyces sp. NPDC057539]|uniref:ATP-binding protein n=1 Tax=Streptomyces sp. NPDC057539 TaxID=3346159 RepID=UPI0036745910